LDKKRGKEIEETYDIKQLKQDVENDKEELDARIRQWKQYHDVTHDLVQRQIAKLWIRIYQDEKENMTISTTLLELISWLQSEAIPHNVGWLVEHYVGQHLGEPIRKEATRAARLYAVKEFRHLLRLLKRRGSKDKASKPPDPRHFT